MVTSISGGESFTCALLQSGKTKCWGAGADGQLGHNSNNESLTPIEVSNLSEGLVLGVGSSHACVVSVDKKSRCWGKNSNGQLGNNSLTSSSVPVEASGSEQWLSVSAHNGSHSCAVTADAKAKCWGANGFGQIGSGNTNDVRVAVDVAELAQVSQIATGSEFSCAVLVRNGAVKCWGRGVLGQLGQGANQNSVEPVSVEF